MEDQLPSATSGDKNNQWSKKTFSEIYGQLETEIFIWDQVLGILRCFDNFTESYSVGAKKGPPQ